MADPNVPRSKRQWEEEFLAEYLARFHPRARVLTRVRLGPAGTSLPDLTLTDEERRMLGAAFRRWADAVMVDEGTCSVIEAAMIPDPRDISLLQTYMLLLDSTPELQELVGLPRQGLLVWAVDDPFTRQVAVSQGLAVQLYKPTNFLEYLHQVRVRDTRPARTFPPEMTRAGT